METIKIQGTEDTPKVILDKENELMEISGRSLPEDVTAFYEPILNWLNEYSESPNKKTIFNFKLVYFNTASSKLLIPEPPYPGTLYTALAAFIKLGIPWPFTSWQAPHFTGPCVSSWFSAAACA